MNQNSDEVLYGIHPARESLLAGNRKIHSVYICKEKQNKRLKNLIVHAEKKNIPVSFLSNRDLAKVANSDDHQGVAMRVSRYRLTDFDAFFLKRTLESNDLFLIFDQIQDPHNLGALLRTGICVGVKGFIIPKDRSASPTPAVSKASAGALEHAQLIQVNNLASTVKELKQMGIWVFGLDMASSQTIFDADYKIPMAIAIGSEEKGIRPLVKKQCDFILSIPQAGKISSLNASAAGSIALYEVFRQRLTRALPAIRS